MKFISRNTQVAEKAPPLFDSHYYLSMYADVAQAGIDPLVHYSTAGWRERRDPHPLFDTAYYLDSNPDIAEAGIDPLQHYLKDGWRERRDPHPLFDTAYYLDSNPDVAEAGIDPLQHYLKDGWREGRDPHPLFETRLYLRLNPDLASLNGPPLLHYVTRGRAEGRSWPTIDRPFELPGLENALDLLPIEFESYDTPRISIIIPVRGQPEHTVRCLHGLRRHRTAHRFEVIVAQDGGDEPTRLALAQITGIHVTRSDVPQGFVAACNAGASIARGEFFLFLNNDTYVEPGWLDELVAGFDQLPSAGAIGSALIYPTGRLQEAGAIVWRDGSGHNIGRNHDPNEPCYSFAREVDYCSAASLLVRASLFRALDGFDQLYAPAYYEDTDLCFRIRKAGYRVYCQPLSRVVHVEGGTAGTDLSQGIKRFQEVNRTKFHQRWEKELAGRKAAEPFEPEVYRNLGQRRVLVVDHKLPATDHDAGSGMTIELMRLLHALGYAVVFGAASPIAGRDRQVTDLERLGIEVIRGPYHNGVPGFLAAHGGGIDLILMVRHHVASWIMPLARMLPKRPGLIILNADLHYLRAERMAALYLNPQQAMAAVQEKVQELSAFRSSDLVITHSEQEQAIVQRELPGTPVEVVPWIARTVAAGPDFNDRADLLFIGGFDHLPNVDAAVFFVVHLWPLLRARLPELRLRIVGSNAGPAIQALGGENGVDVIGHVADLRSELDRARVAIAPLRWGAGFKGKVATALAAGLPNVLTPIAAEGMGLTDGQSCLIAELNEHFVHEVYHLYTDRDRWREIAQNGLAFASQNWSPARNTDRLIRALHRARVPPTFALSDHLEARALKYV